MKTDSKRTLKEDYRILKRAVSLINTFTPHFIFHCCFFSFCYSATYVCSNYITAAIVDELTGDRNLKKLIILASFYLIEIVLKAARDYSWRRIRTFDIIAPKWEEQLLNKKSFSMDYRKTEDPSVRAMRQMLTARSGESGFKEITMQIIFFFDGFWFFTLCSALLIAIFFKHSERVLTAGEKFIDSPLFTLCFFIVIGILAFFQYKYEFSISRNITDIQKKLGLSKNHLNYYFDEYLDDSKSAKDMHIFNQKGLIFYSLNRFYDKWESFVKSEASENKKRENCHLIFYLINLALTYLFISLKIYIGAFGIGGFIKYHYGVARVCESIYTFSYTISRLRANNDYLELFFDYLDMPSEMHCGKIPTEKRSDNIYDIEFHNVSFKYPGSDEWAIRNLSFKFTVGEKVAVVGRNGSGKTTMIKLLCRLYDPTDGFITLNGIDIKKYDYEDYMALFSVVFQDFRLFSFTLGENVASEKDYDSRKALACIETAGLASLIKALPNGLDSVIYKDFDENGIEISGGEAQKIAIARALYKNAPFVILDEPTASLDPLAEYEIYSHFNAMVKNKTAVYISHRLSSCRFCDKIAVFDAGEIVQFGSHDELLRDRDAKYYELWHAQAQYYTVDNS